MVDDKKESAYASKLRELGFAPISAEEQARREARHAEILEHWRRYREQREEFANTLGAKDRKLLECKKDPPAFIIDRRKGNIKLIDEFGEGWSFEGILDAKVLTDLGFRDYTPPPLPSPSSLYYDPGTSTTH